MCSNDDPGDHLVKFPGQFQTLGFVTILDWSKIWDLSIVRMWSPGFRQQIWVCARNDRYVRWKISPGRNQLMMVETFEACLLRLWSSYGQHGQDANLEDVVLYIQLATTVGNDVVLPDHWTKVLNTSKTSKTWCLFLYVKQTYSEQSCPLWIRPKLEGTWNYLSLIYSTLQ